MRMLDLFCGRWGWSKAFAARGWRCTGIDLVQPPTIPDGCIWFDWNVLTISHDYLTSFDFICASSPCEQFSVHGMKHFHPNPPYPELGIKLFNHTREICEASGVPYVMENVRAAQQFVGNAKLRCGSFYLWGNGVPPLIPRNIFKAKWKKSMEGRPGNTTPDVWGDKKERARKWATIPPELANCVADYAERLIEQLSTAPSKINT